ncbi:hypothetical protein B0H12DRAFT_1243233 [Mycena haematopus]|nr:hypothetical protein B0H12DRAFT_1243233 [Mycena haematopus]
MSARVDAHLPPDGTVIFGLLSRARPRPRLGSSYWPGAQNGSGRRARNGAHQGGRMEREQGVKRVAVEECLEAYARSVVSGVIVLTLPPRRSQRRVPRLPRLTHTRLIKDALPHTYRSLLPNASRLNPRDLDTSLGASSRILGLVVLLRAVDCFIHTTFPFSTATSSSFCVRLSSSGTTPTHGATPYLTPSPASPPYLHPALPTTPLDRL